VKLSKVKIKIEPNKKITKDNSHKIKPIVKYPIAILKNNTQSPKNKATRSLLLLSKVISCWHFGQSHFDHINLKSNLFT